MKLDDNRKGLSDLVNMSDALVQNKNNHNLISELERIISAEGIEFTDEKGFQVKLSFEKTNQEGVIKVIKNKKNEQETSMEFFVNTKQGSYEVKYGGNSMTREERKDFFTKIFGIISEYEKHLEEIDVVRNSSIDKALKIL